MRIASTSNPFAEKMVHFCAAKIGKRSNADVRQSTFGKALLRTIAPSYQGKSGFFVIPADAGIQ